jgi:uncharacterized alpha-E superfamily protein
MLARIAHELFWLGRDLSRAEHTARTLDGVFHADVAGVPGEPSITLSWEAVLTIIGGSSSSSDEGTAERARPRAVPARRGETAQLLSSDAENPASIISCVSRARERGRTLRDVISSEMWQALNAFYLLLARGDLAGSLQSGPYSFYRLVKERCALFWGLADRTMLHDEGRAFLEAGSRIDAADMVLRMLRVTVPGEPGEDGHQSEAIALLRAVGGTQAYRRAVREAPTVLPAVRFLLYEAAYPGSVSSSVQALRDALSGADAQPRSSPPILRLGRLIAELELLHRTLGESSALQTILERIQDELWIVDREIGERYFAVATAPPIHR